jgi:hypothetical protein
MADENFPPSPVASVCGFSIGLPRISFPFPPTLPSLAFLTNLIPIPFLGFRLTCDLSHPVDITAGLKLPFGGGRTANNDPDPDDQDDYP